MNRASLFRLLAAAAPILLAGLACGAPADSAHSYPIRDAARWLPREIAVGPQAGAQLSRMRISGGYRSLLEPVPAEERPWIGPSLGAAVSLRWSRGFSLALSPRREGFGMRTGEDTVSFAGNPYPHTLSARTELEYNLWPLLAGYDWTRGRQRVGLQAGVFQAFLSHLGFGWTVDGEPYSRRPDASARESVAGWLAAAEYGYRQGRGELILGLEYQHAFESAMRGQDGAVRIDAVQLRLGYAWAVWRRLP